MSKERERFAKDALAAYEQGYFIVAARLNEILAKRAPGLRIPAAPPEPGLTLTDAAHRLRNALAVLRTFDPDMDDERHIVPWTLGYVSGFSHPPERVGLRPNEDHIASTLRSLDERCSDCPPEWWKAEIIDSVQVYEAQQRRWFVRQENGARLDSVEAIREYVEELRARWPEPDDWPPLDPAGILEQLWVVMYMRGLSPERLHPMAPSSKKLFAVRSREDADAHAVRVEEWGYFHEALNRASKAIETAIEAGGTKEPESPATKSEQRATWLAKAMLLVRDHPGWSDAEIARRVKVDRSTLSRSQEYQVASAMARGDKTDRPEGHVKVDSETGKTDVESYTDDDPAKKDWDD